MAESSKSAEKRAKKQRQAIFATMLENRNRGISITNEEPSEGNEVPCETNTPSEQNTQDTDATNNAKKRNLCGPTRMALLKGKEPVEVDVNMLGQVVDGNSISLASYIGTIAREHVPVTLKSWKQLEDSKKDMLWSCLLQYFKLPNSSKEFIFKKMGSRWRQYKSTITKKLIEANKKKGRKRAFRRIKPSNVTNEEEWGAFVKHRISSTFEARTKKFRDMRNSQYIHHTTGRRGFARLQHLMKKEAEAKGKDPESVTRVDVWIKGHTRKNGLPMSQDVENIINEIDELRASQNPPNDDNIYEDAITRVLGRDKHGQVRGLGYGATPSRVDAQFQSEQKMKVLETKLKETNDELAKLRELVVSVMKQNDSLLNRCGVEDIVASHACAPSQAYTPQSQHGSAHVTQGNAQLENARCQLLHWYPENNVEDQVVAEGRISSTDPKALVHHIPLGRSYWKVWVDVVEEDIKVCRPTDEYETLNEAMGTTVAWLKDYIKLL